MFSEQENTLQHAGAATCRYAVSYDRRCLKRRAERAVYDARARHVMRRYDNRRHIIVY